MAAPAWGVITEPMSRLPSALLSLKPSAIWLVMTVVPSSRTRHRDTCSFAFGVRRARPGRSELLGLLRGVDAHCKVVRGPVAQPDHDSDSLALLVLLEGDHLPNGVGRE